MTGINGIATETAELSVFVNNAVATLDEIKDTIRLMDQKMADSINDKSGVARDHVAQTWVGIFENLKGSVNGLGSLLNAAGAVQTATEAYNNSI